MTIHQKGSQPSATATRRYVPVSVHDKSAPRLTPYADMEPPLAVLDHPANAKDGQQTDNPNRRPVPAWRLSVSSTFSAAAVRVLLPCIHVYLGYAFSASGSTPQSPIEIIRRTRLLSHRPLIRRLLPSPVYLWLWRTYKRVSPARPPVSDNRFQQLEQLRIQGLEIRQVRESIIRQEGHVSG